MHRWKNIPTKGEKKDLAWVKLLLYRARGEKEQHPFYSIQGKVTIKDPCQLERTTPSAHVFSAAPAG